MLAARSASAIDDKNGGRLLANSSAAPQSAGSAVSLKFTGKAGEYFRIWIVNVCPVAKRTDVIPAKTSEGEFRGTAKRGSSDFRAAGFPLVRE